MNESFISSQPLQVLDGRDGRCTSENITNNVLFTANVLVCLTSKGVTARVTPVIGLGDAF
jgi:hypothetical protein